MRHQEKKYLVNSFDKILKLRIRIKTERLGCM